MEKEYLISLLAYLKARCDFLGFTSNINGLSTAIPSYITRDKTADELITELKKIKNEYATWDELINSYINLKESEDTLLNCVLLTEHCPNAVLDFMLKEVADNRDLQLKMIKFLINNISVL